MYIKPKYLVPFTNIHNDIFNGSFSGNDIIVFCTAEYLSMYDLDDSKNYKKLKSLTGLNDYELIKSWENIKRVGVTYGK